MRFSTTSQRVVKYYMIAEFHANTLYPSLYYIMFYTIQYTIVKCFITLVGMKQENTAVFSGIV